MMVVGLTGGIGSGKSTIAEMFGSLNIPIYDSDFNAKKLMVESRELKQAITHLLGEESYTDGALNRAYIAKKVFEDAHLLEKLNKIVHPAVREHFLDWSKKQESPYVIQESALIFENENQDLYDAIILVTAPIKIRVKRVTQRDKSKESDVLKRIQHQMKDGEKEKMAHFQIENIDLETTQKRVLEVHEALIKSII